MEGIAVDDDLRQRWVVVDRRRDLVITVCSEIHADEAHDRPNDDDADACDEPDHSGSFARRKTGRTWDRMKRTWHVGVMASGSRNRSGTTTWKGP
jgi:hypothetical protein